MIFLGGFIMEQAANYNLAVKDTKQIITRPPVVVLLGHVDHGKTTLLDAISGTALAKKEFGEITQNIKAYQVTTLHGLITFIDTPGHSYFTNLRGEGTKFADVALLVVSAVEGIKEQTTESIKIIKDAKIPLICVLSKIDLPEAKPEVVKTQLAKVGITLEGAGGQTPLVEVSATKKIGIDNLTETISILATLEDFKTDLSKPVSGVVLDSYLNKKMGPLALVWAKEGILKTGEKILVDGVSGKIRAIFDQNGSSILEAVPSQPVEILGLGKIVNAGSRFREAEAEDVNIPSEVIPKKFSLPERELSKKLLPIIIKANSFGGKNAILANLPENVNIIDSGIGQVTGGDVEKASALGAKIFAFSVSLTPDAAKLLANTKNVFFQSKLIYELIEEIKKQSQSFAQSKEVVLGTAKILKTFDINGIRIAGCKVLGGFCKKGGRVKIVRGDKEIGISQIASIKQLAKSVEKVTAGTECGIGFSSPVDFRVDDVLKFVSSPEEVKS